jgi:hypothetical protein
VKVAGKGIKKAKKLKSGLSLSIETETLKPLKNEKCEKFAQLVNSMDIGNIATGIIGEIIYNEFKESIEDYPDKKINMIIRESSGGCDIEIVIDGKIIEIEIKNYKIEKDNPYLIPYHINKKVIPRFKHPDSIKFLFSCGRDCNKDARKILKDNNITFRRLSYKQLKKDDKDRKHHIKKIMREFVKEIIK